MDRKILPITGFGFSEGAKCAFLDLQEEPVAITFGPQRNFLVGAIIPIDRDPGYFFGSGDKLLELALQRDASAEVFVLSISYEQRSGGTVSVDIGTWPLDQEKEIQPWLSDVNARIKSALLPQNVPQ